MEFRSFTDPGAFTVADGGQFDFTGLSPGIYVVVQAPPIPGHRLQWGCTNGQFPDHVKITGQDDVTCTFTDVVP